MFEIQKNMETNSLICYVIEYTGKDSYVAKYELTNELVGGLRHLARADFWLLVIHLLIALISFNIIIFNEFIMVRNF